MAFFIRFFGQGQPPDMAGLSAPVAQTVPAMPPDLTTATDPIRRGKPPFHPSTASPIVQGRLALNLPGDDVFDDESTERPEWAASEKMVAMTPDACDPLTATRGAATFIISVQHLSGGQNPDGVPDRVDPLWTALNERHTGIIPADGDGFSFGSYAASQAALNMTPFPFIKELSCR